MERRSMGDEYNFGQVDIEGTLATFAEKIEKEDSKDAFVKLLKESYVLLEGAEQSPAMLRSVTPFISALAQPRLLRNTDKGVRIYLAACFVEILRISAPETMFSEEAMKALFVQVISVFELLRDSLAASFRVCAAVLQAFASVRCGILLWDLDAENLVERLFLSLLYSVNACNEDVITSPALQTLAYMLEEADDIPQALIDALLESLESPESNPARTRLVQRLIKQAERFLGMYLQKILTRVVEAGGDPYHNHHKLLLAVHQATPQLLLPVLPHLCPQLESEEEARRHSAAETAGHLFSSADAELASEYPELFSSFLRRFRDQKVEVRSEVLGFAMDVFRACTSVEHKSKVLSAAAERLRDPDERVRAKAVASVCSIGAEELALLEPEAIRTAVGRTMDAKASVRREAAKALAAMFRRCCKAILNGSTADVAQAVLEIPGVLLLGSARDPDPTIRAVIEWELQEGLLPGGDFPSEQAAQIWAQVYGHTGEASQKALAAFLARRRRFKGGLLDLLQAHDLLRASASGMAGESIDSREAASEAVAAASKRLAQQLPDSGRAADQLRKLLQLKDRNVFRTLKRLAQQDLSSKDFDPLASELLRAIGAARSAARDFGSVLVRRLRAAPLSSEHLRGLLTIAADPEARTADPPIRGSLGLLSLAAAADPAIFTSLLGPVVDLLAAGAGAADGRGACACRILAAAGSHIKQDLSSHKAGRVGVGRLGQAAELEAGRGQVQPEASADASAMADTVFPLLESAASKCRQVAKFAGKAFAALAVAFGENMKLRKVTRGLVLKLESFAEEGGSNQRAADDEEAEEGGGDALAVLEAIAGIGRVEPGYLAPHVPAIAEVVLGGILRNPPVPQQETPTDPARGRGKQWRGSAGGGARWEEPLAGIAVREAALKLLARALVPDDQAKPIPKETQEAVEMLVPKLDRLLDPDTDLEAEIGVEGEAGQGHIRLGAACALLRLARRHDASIPAQNYVNLSLVAQDPMMEVRAAFTVKVLKTAKHFEARRMHSLSYKYAATLSLSAIDPARGASERVAKGMGAFIVARRHMIQTTLTVEACSLGRGGCNLPEQPEFMLPYAIFVLAHHPDFPEVVQEATNEDLRPWEDMLVFLMEQLLGNGAEEQGSSLPGIFKMLRTIKCSGDVLVRGLSNNISAICDMAIMLLGGPQRLQSLPAFPARIPLPRSLYQALEQAPSSESTRFGIHLPRGFRVKRVIGEVAAEDGPRRSSGPEQRNAGAAFERKRQRTPEDRAGLSAPPVAMDKAVKGTEKPSPTTQAIQVVTPTEAAHGARKRRSQAEADSNEPSGGVSEKAGDDGEASLGIHVEDSKAKPRVSSAKRTHKKQTTAISRASPSPMGISGSSSQALKDIPLNSPNRSQERVTRSRR